MLLPVLSILSIRCYYRLDLLLILHRKLWVIVDVLYCTLTWTCCLTTCRAIRLGSMLVSFGLRRWYLNHLSGLWCCLFSFNSYRSSSQCSSYRFVNAVDAVGLVSSINPSLVTCIVSILGLDMISCWWGFLLRDALLLLPANTTVFSSPNTTPPLSSNDSCRPSPSSRSAFVLLLMLLLLSMLLFLCYGSCWHTRRVLNSRRL